ncbi:9cfcc38d-e79b-428f-9981-859ce0d92ded-CDS [Sclerotinia trifoliorum]|uniref:9cfcc38d-e79b-428f-9981-859ce0d92ded-CDS n=1 Tax=Sclerotinia trifoliorum TaxID=28548 RepID=A0A8H2ZXC7_9HELO|nr:9cfcc38d-e79b-428f-9981-859ce0d92ded-CDS [Sclerotinia trifoliorum]
MFFSKRLVCFYCGRKSNLRFDNTMSQFDCDTCEATNFLDRDGNIADPPTSITQPTLNNQYADSNSASSSTGSSIFCDRCLRNQQYHCDVMKQLNVELDPRHPNYQISKEKIRNVKRDLDKRYPMVCEKCAPKAQEQRDKADKFAKSDWLGRLNALSESIRSQKTWKDTFKNVIYQTLLYPIVSKIWYLVVIGQMLALVLGLFNVTYILTNALNLIPYFSNDLKLNIISFLSSKRYLGWSILYNFLSCGMNPFFSRWYPRGNPKRIVGFFNWYGYQLLLQLVLRVILCSIFGNGFFTQLSSFTTMIANGFTIFFNFLIAYGSRFYLGPKKISLWKSKPGPIFTPQTFETSEKSGNAMSDVLDEIMASSPKDHHQTPSPPTYPTQRSSPYNQEQSLQHVGQSHTSGFHEKPSVNIYGQNYNRHHEIARQTDLLLKTNTSGLNSAEFNDYLATGELPDWKVQEGEEMDWDPTVTRVKHDFNVHHRALDTTSNYETQVQPFGQSTSFQSSNSFNGPSPFYGKLPAAPISPAHRLRNPPNRPRLEVPSAQRKENFFNSMTQKPAFGKANKDHYEIQIADPKLHVANPKAYQLDNGFEEAFGKFSIEEKEETPAKEFGKLSMGKAIGLSLLFGGLAVGAGAFYKSKSSSQDETSSSLETMTIENTSTL